MRQRLFFTVALHLLLGLVAQATGPARPVQPSWGTAASGSRPRYARDQILVKRKQSGGLAPQSESPMVQVVRLTGGASVEASLRAYNARDDIEYAEPDWEIMPDVEPNDPLYKGSSWGVREIRAHFAWNITTGSSNVTVCVVDSGIDHTHPDLAPNMHPLIGLNTLNDKLKPMDDSWGHGTHVAGIIAAVGNNTRLATGVAWRARLLACKFMHDGSGFASNAVRCIKWCQSKGARIINASWSIGKNYSQTLEDAIEWAGTKQVLFVGSAGNSGLNLDDKKTPNYPASYNLPNQLVVGAIGPTRQLMGFSNYGATRVHIVAPGENIISTLPGNRYANLTGTSMAAPLVTGAAALLLSVGGPNLLAAKLRSLLLSTALVNGTGLRGKVLSGLLDVEAAVAKHRMETAVTEPKSTYCRKNPCVRTYNPKTNRYTYVALPKAKSGRRLLRGSAGFDHLGWS